MSTWTTSSFWWMGVLFPCQFYVVWLAGCILWRAKQAARKLKITVIKIIWDVPYFPHQLKSVYFPQHVILEYWCKVIIYCYASCYICVVACESAQLFALFVYFSFFCVSVCISFKDFVPFPLKDATPTCTFRT